MNVRLRPGDREIIEARFVVTDSMEPWRSELCGIGKSRRRNMNETGKIAASLAADIVGYSRLTGTDEDRTLARLRALRAKRSQRDRRPSET